MRCTITRSSSGRSDTCWRTRRAASGKRPFLLWRDERFTYAELEAWTNRYANGFRAAGIGRGDHVAVMMSNCPEFFWVIWGLAKLGAAAVPLNTAAQGELLRYFIAQSDSVAVVMGAEWAPRIEAVAGELGGVRHWFTRLR